MHRVGVAIIDSGVNPHHPHIGNVISGRCFVPGEPPDNYLDSLGHGTAVAGAICEKTSFVDLYIARVFHRRLVTSIDVLMGALDWCLDQPVRLVNMSLATDNLAHLGLFTQRVDQATTKGIRIVSPATGLPGRLSGVTGVELDDSVDRNTFREGYAACGWPRPIPGQPQERNLHGISFAVANVTGCLARNLAAGEDSPSSL
ncbi:MAG: S8 family serine peptidase [Bryobacteraceae bacterium]|nr:S8 family serine peptidase [Bryobacteraceae bacterium]